MKNEFNIEVSLTTIRKVLKYELGLSYKKIYRGAIRVNWIESKQRR